MSSSVSPLRRLFSAVVRLVRRSPGAEASTRPGDVPLTGFYQDKVAPAFAARVRLLESAVGPDARSVLDLGANLCEFTVHFARRGLLAIGVEVDPKIARAARARHADAANLGIVQAEVDPSTVGSLPGTDAVLLLSVHHNWIAAHGPEVGDRMVRTVVEKAGQVVVFEAPSRNVRFGGHQPGFVDNDETSVRAYYEGYLARVAGDLTREIRFLGGTPALGEREPVRWMWALVKVAV